MSSSPSRLAATIEYVGDIDVVFIPERGSAELTLVIGDARFRGQRVGTEAVQRVLRWLFSEVPLTPSTEVAALDRPQFPWHTSRSTRNPAATRWPIGGSDRASGFTVSRTGFTGFGPLAKSGWHHLQTRARRTLHQPGDRHSPARPRRPSLAR
ncbi:MAG TPA: hypothetical protein DGR79_05275 [Clostridiales bacterium]|nr:hypothetical protein [Clostridiales bacterium]